MVIIQNDINQTINFVDDRAASTGFVDLQLTHVATDKVVNFDNNIVSSSSFVIDASELRNGLHLAIISSVTSFIIQVVDVNSINLPENSEKIDLGYKNN